MPMPSTPTDSVSGGSGVGDGAGVAVAVGAGLGVGGDAPEQAASSTIPATASQGTGERGWGMVPILRTVSAAISA